MGNERGQLVECLAVPDLAIDIDIWNGSIPSKCAVAGINGIPSRPLKEMKTVLV